MLITKFIRRLFSSKQPTHPAIVANNLISVASDRGLPVRDCEFVVFDTELTGLNQRKDEIIAIGGVRIKNLRICCEDTFYALIKPRENFIPPAPSFTGLRLVNYWGLNPQMMFCPVS